MLVTTKFLVAMEMTRWKATRDMTTWMVGRVTMNYLPVKEMTFSMVVQVTIG